MTILRGAGIISVTIEKLGFPGHMNHYRCVSLDTGYVTAIEARDLRHLGTFIEGKLVVNRFAGVPERELGEQAGRAGPQVGKRVTHELEQTTIYDYTVWSEYCDNLPHR
jgi:hypothetical protein